MNAKEANALANCERYATIKNEIKNMALRGWFSCKIQLTEDEKAILRSEGFSLVDCEPKDLELLDYVRVSWVQV